MTWVITSYGSSEGYGGSAGVDVGAANTPTEGDMIVVALMFWSGNTVDSITAANWNLSEAFTQVGSDQTNGSETLRIYAGIVGASPSSDQVNIDFNNDVNYNACVFRINEDTNGLASTIANILERQTPIQETSYNGGPANPIGAGFASAFASSSNMTLCCFCSGSSAQTFTPQTGFTELMEQSTLFGAVVVQYKTTEESAPDYSPTESSQDNAAIAFEVAQGAGGGGAGSLFELKQTLPTYILAR